MTKAKSKSSGTPRRASSSKKTSVAGAWYRSGWLSFAVAALGSFQIASCSLNPHWPTRQWDVAQLTSLTSAAKNAATHATANAVTQAATGAATQMATDAASAIQSTLTSKLAAIFDFTPQLQALRELGRKIDTSQYRAEGAGSISVSVSGKVEPAHPSADQTSGQNSGSTTLASGFAHCPQFFPHGAVPQIQAQPRLRELCFSGFAVLHDGASKTPVFVAQRLNRSLLQQGKGLARTDKFYADARLPRAERAELSDYKSSGFARGHMAPAGDMYSEDTMAQSFSLANMVPQDQKQNSGPWSQVEQATRKYVQRALGDVFVFTGPVFETPVQTIGPGKVHVPSFIFKLVYDANTGRSWVYWLPNSADARMSAPISYEEFTRRTGMPLLAKVLTAAQGESRTRDQ